jgi:chaperonin GroEL (HSP60 family)
MMITVKKCKNPRVVSILIHGGTDHIVEEMDRAVYDALRVTQASIEDGKIVAGGSAPEIEIALGLRDYASSLSGREQLAIMAFADAIEVIPKTLAENSGLDPIDTLVTLRASHESGNSTTGIDINTGKAVEMWPDVVEPLRTKKQAILSASEAANMIVRIDDVIQAAKFEKPAAPEGGMGEMPEDMTD